jgi:hypothetical protein
MLALSGEICTIGVSKRAYSVSSLTHSCPPGNMLSAWAFTEGSSYVHALSYSTGTGQKHF